MEFLIIVGQRGGSYPDEYAPEALDVIDDFANDENPDFLVERMQEYRGSNEFDALAIVRIRVPQSAISGALYPERQAIEGTFVADPTPQGQPNE